MMQISVLSAFLQLWLASLVAAAPVAGEVTANGNNAWEYGTSGGIIGLIVLILDIIVFGTPIFPQADPRRSRCRGHLLTAVVPIVEVLQSTRSPMSKLIWSLVVFLFPVIGMVVYWLFSHREAHKRGAGYEPVS